MATIRQKTASDRQYRLGVVSAYMDSGPNVDLCAEVRLLPGPLMT